MTIVPISATEPACYGIACPVHQMCARYQAVDNMPSGTVVIGHCGDMADYRPLFADIFKEAGT